MRIALLLFVGTLVWMPLIVGAQERLVPCDGPDCSACHIVSLIQNILNFLITFTVVASGIVFAWAGLKMVMSAGNESEVSAAKGMITNVVVGLVILLSAWLVVDTLMKFPGFTNSALFGEGSKFGPWNEIRCTAPVATAPAPSTPGTITTAPGTGVVAEGELAHEAAVSELTAAGIVVTSTSGTGGVSADCSGNGCTSLQGIKEQVVAQVITIKENCNCSLEVTGGTEGGDVHEDGEFSHGNGYKIDLDDSSSLDTYLTSNLTRSGTRSGKGAGARYLDSCGNEYVRESTHWDITVSKGTCSI